MRLNVLILVLMLVGVWQIRKTKAEVRDIEKELKEKSEKVVKQVDESKKEGGILVEYKYLSSLAGGIVGDENGIGYFQGMLTPTGVVVSVQDTYVRLRTFAGQDLFYVDPKAYQWARSQVFEAIREGMPPPRKQLTTKD